MYVWMPQACMLCLNSLGVYVWTRWACMFELPRRKCLKPLTARWEGGSHVCMYVCLKHPSMHACTFEIAKHVCMFENPLSMYVCLGSSEHVCMSPNMHVWMYVWDTLNYHTRVGSSWKNHEKRCGYLNDNVMFWALWCLKTLCLSWPHDIHTRLNKHTRLNASYKNQTKCKVVSVYVWKPSAKHVCMLCMYVCLGPPKYRSSKSQKMLVWQMTERFSWGNWACMYVWKLCMYVCETCMPPEVHP